MDFIRFFEGLMYKRNNLNVTLMKYNSINYDHLGIEKEPIKIS